MSFRLGSFPLGDIVTGQITKLEPRGVLVAFGTEQPAFVALSELSLAKIQSPEEVLRLNEIREFLVVGSYDWEYDYFFSDCTPETLNNGDLLYKVAQSRASLGRRHLVSREDLIIHTKILAIQPDGVFARIQWFLCSDHPPTITFSIRRLEIQIAWRRIRQLQSEDVTLYLKVVKKTSLNAIVKIEGLQGFIDNIDRCREKLLVGEELPLKIIEAKEELNRLRLIHCSTLSKLRQLQVGQTVSGTVQAIKPYGIFVDIEGLHAFLPASKIIPTVDHPGQILKVNDSVKVVIAEIDLEKAQVNLGSCEKSA